VLKRSNLEHHSNLVHRKIIDYTIDNLRSNVQHCTAWHRRKSFSDVTIRRVSCQHMSRTIDLF